MNISGFSGNLTQTPELKTTQSGKSVCSFTVAVRRPHTKETTDFIDCVAWERLAEFVTRYFQKGSRVEVSGFLTTRTYGTEGNRRKATELVCEDINFGGSKKDDEGNQASQATSQQSDGFEEISDDDDLPF